RLVGTGRADDRGDDRVHPADRRQRAGARPHRGRAQQPGQPLHRLGREGVPRSVAGRAPGTFRPAGATRAPAPRRARSRTDPAPRATARLNTTPTPPPASHGTSTAEGVPGTVPGSGELG